MEKIDIVEMLMNALTTEIRKNKMRGQYSKLNLAISTGIKLSNIFTRTKSYVNENEKISCFTLCRSNYRYTDFNILKPYEKPACSLTIIFISFYQFL